MEDSNHNLVAFINPCSHCGKSLKDEWKFCPYCRNEVEYHQCVFCLKDIKTQWNYCPYCRKQVKSEQMSSKKLDQANDWLRSVLKK